MALDGKTFSVSRMIVQMTGQAPLENARGDDEQERAYGCAGGHSRPEPSWWAPRM